MAIVMVNGGGNTPQGDVTDGTSNTLMFGESSSAAHGASTDGQPTNWPMLLRMEHELAADNALSFDAYDASAGTSLPRTVVDGTSNTLTFGEPYVPTGHECLVFFLGGEDPTSNAGLLGGVTVAAGDMNADAQRYSFLFDGNSQTDVDHDGIAWVSGRGGVRGVLPDAPTPETDWLLV